MRSIYTAVALCAVTLMMTTGCAFKISGPCKSLTHSCNGPNCKLTIEDNCFGWLRNALFGCAGGSCNAATASLSDCGCEDSSCSGGCYPSPFNGGGSTCRDGGCSLKLPSLRLPAPALFAGQGLASCSAPSGDCGCGDSGCGGCQSGGMSGLFTGGMPVGESACNDCEMGMRLPRPAKLFGGLGMPSGVGFRGCGKFGCGGGGKLCLPCRMKGGNGIGAGLSGAAASFGDAVSGGCGAPGCGTGSGGCGCGLGGAGLHGAGLHGAGSRLYGGALHRGVSHVLPGKHPYGGAVPHTAQGPGSAGTAPTYAYPYYTTRGPRDFLQDNPPTIGW